MQRRRALAFLAAFAMPAAFAQRTRQVRRMRRVTVFFFGTPANSRTRREAFLKAMTELGYVEGRAVRYDFRYANGQPDLAAQHAREIAHEIADVVVSFSASNAQALRDAHVSWPVVMIGVDDPVRGGLAHDLARPGTNFTGMTTNVIAQAPRYVDLLHEAVGKAALVGLLASPASTTYGVFRSRVEEQAARRGIRIVPLDVASPADIEHAIDPRHGVHAFIVTSDTMIYNERRRIAELATEARLPGIYPRSGYVDVGGLMSFAPNEEYTATRGASFVSRILEGDAPSEMPIEGPTRYELRVNRKAAQAIGLALPAPFLQRADRVVG